METIFPDGAALAGVFVVGKRKKPGSATTIERTGTIILKRAYDVSPSSTDPALGSVTPAAAPRDVLLVDNTQPIVSPPIVRFENDLAAFKPEGDLIAICDVLPAPHSLRVNGGLRLRRAPHPPEGPLRDLGWAEQKNSPRVDDAGTLDPPPQTLPADFNNRFFNGYRRDRKVAALPYLQRGDRIEIERDGGSRYGFTLADEVVTATHFYFTGHGVDSEYRWRSHAVAMNLDTLVIEPDQDRCYAVWRGAWPIGEDPEDPSRALPESLHRRVVVTVEEG